MLTIMKRRFSYFLLLLIYYLLYSHPVGVYRTNLMREYQFHFFLWSQTTQTHCQLKGLWIFIRLYVCVFFQGSRTSHTTYAFQLLEFVPLWNSSYFITCVLSSLMGPTRNNSMSIYLFFYLQCENRFFKTFCSLSGNGNPSSFVGVYTN